MKNKFIFLIIFFIIWPLLTKADGGVIKPLPNGDWTWVDENSQQAFINFEKGIEKLIIAINLKEENSDIAWIIPVPSNPEKVGIDITSELPIFFGDDVISKAKLKFSESLKASYYGGLLGQISTFPLIIFASLSGAHGGKPSGEMISGDLISVESHIEKAGMVAEVITAKNSQTIYDYFSQKGFNIKQGGISELDSYIEKDYSFVVSWITSGILSKENRGQRGIFISFPTPKIYYPLVLTSAYGETEIPIVIRVLGHVKPEIFSEIKPYTEISYYTKRTRGYSGAWEARCQSEMYQFKAILELYHSDHNSYPSSLQELLNSEYGNPAKTIIEDIKNICQGYPSYFSKNSTDYTMRLGLPTGLFEINSSGFAGYTKSIEKFIPSELQKFYGDKKPWAGEAEYTKISINSPARLLKKDLWVESKRPLKISFAMWAIENSVFVTFLIYLLIVGFVSFIAGGVVGLLCFRKFKKYALVGLGNIFTLISLILIFNYVKKKTKEDIKNSKLGFISQFSIIFLVLLTLIFSLTILIFFENIKNLLLVGIGTSVLGIINVGIFLLIKFLLDKIGLKSKSVRTFLLIVSFILIWIIITTLIFASF